MRYLPASTVRLLSLALLSSAFGPAQAVTADRDAADESALTAIEELGGFARRLPGGKDWEVAFHLRGKKLTDEGLVHVVRLRNVVSLNLRDTRVTDRGLAHLKKLKRLRWLHLERTQVGDAGIAHLSALTSLLYLNLYGTKITDKALEHLVDLKRLRRLYVWNTRVTDAGVERLEKALPRLKIIRGVDLSTLPDYVDEELDIPEPKEDLKWIPVSNSTEAPRSVNGLNTQVFFENKSGQPVKLYWVSYGAELKLYAVLAPGAVRQQNTYSKNTWLITDGNDKPFGYFIVGVEISRAVIPKLK